MLGLENSGVNENGNRTDYPAGSGADDALMGCFRGLDLGRLAGKGGWVH
jgi:hypothetical protein